ncbi:DMT family transporter [Paenarthrobacter sp. NPDC089714]|uniref:DMT family transporter n=1 Tax=Paenarthrobacter sp. NPDC089714 TaxID=3364377 RepID=UPI003820C6D2
MLILTSRRWFWAALTALGSIAFGSVFWVTHTYLPADQPLWGSALRALPAGLVLLLVIRRVPHGKQWGRAIVLGTVNMGAFFLLVYIAAQLLPSSIAASLGAASPLAIAFFAWIILGERTRPWLLLMAVMGIGGVLLIVGTSTKEVNLMGVAAAVGLLVLMSLGAALTKLWNDGASALTWTTWQLVVGGIELFVVAIFAEGAPPELDGAGYLAVSYLTFVATGFAYFCWFSGFEHLPAATVGVLSLLNVVAGVLIGVLIGSEPFTGIQILGTFVVVLSVIGAQRRPAAPAKVESTNATIRSSLSSPALTAGNDNQR